MQNLYISYTTNFILLDNNSIYSLLCFKETKANYYKLCSSMTMNYKW